MKETCCKGLPVLSGRYIVGADRATQTCEPLKLTGIASLLTLNDLQGK